MTRRYGTKGNHSPTGNDLQFIHKPFTVTKRSLIAGNFLLSLRCYSALYWSPTSFALDTPTNLESFPSTASLCLFRVLAEIGASPSWISDGELSLFENCVAAARAPAMATSRLGGFSILIAFEFFESDASDPGFKENRSRESGSGNLTGSGGVTGLRPLTAASYTCANIQE